MAKENNFPQVFDRLKSVLQPFATKLIVKDDQSNTFILVSRKRDEKNKEIYFAMVQIKKNYVSFHFMPVYVAPELLDNVSPALKKQVQGKSCFNFKTVEDELFAELLDVTKKGFELYRQRDLL